MTTKAGITDRANASVLYFWDDDRPVPRIGDKIWLGVNCWLVDAVVWDYPAVDSIAHRGGVRAAVEILVVPTTGEHS